MTKTKVTTYTVDSYGYDMQSPAGDWWAVGFSGSGEPVAQIPDRGTVPEAALREMIARRWPGAREAAG